MNGMDLYVEDWGDLTDQLSVEPMPELANAAGSTVGTLSSASTLSCPGGCVYTYTTASSAS